MNELITACIRDKQISPISEFPKHLLNETELEMFNFIIGYYAKYSTMVSIKYFEKEFEFFIPIDDGFSCFEVFEICKKDRTFQKVSSLVGELAYGITAKKHLDLEKINEILLINSLSDGVEMFSEFDRSSYLRKNLSKIPFKVINKATDGIAGGEFLLVAGRLGVGKSTILRWIAKSAVLEGKKILFISTESMVSEVFSAIDGMVSGFSKEKIIESVEDGDYKSPVVPGEIFSRSGGAMDTNYIAATAKSLMVDMIIIDGVYLLKPSSVKSGSKWEKVSAVSNEIKQMALDLKIPVIGSTQIKRGAGSDGEYSAEDLSFADALGQDADYVLTMKPEAIIKNRIQLDLIKNRFGYNASTVIFVDHENSRIIEESVEGRFEGPKAEVETISIGEWLES